ncbi:MAG: hypothetical protein AAF196_05025 [Planctomycetota bacterium]
MKSRPSEHSDGGFTLLELVVVMGLLAGLLGLLVQLLASGGSIYQRGEEGRDLSDRSLAAASLARDLVQQLEGPRASSDAGEAYPDARFLLYEVTGGAVPEQGALGIDDSVPVTVQVLRSTARLERGLEARLLQELRRALGYEDDEGLTTDDAEEFEVPLAATGRGELMLFSWPSDKDGVFLDLYLKRRLTIEESRLDDELFLVELALPEDLEFNQRVETQGARKISQSLLYFGIECWSQNTRRWSSPGESGPRRVWDSARALTLPEDQSQAFGYDRSDESLLDPRDDLYPHYLRLTIVVSRGPEIAAKTFLSGGVDRTSLEIRVVAPEELEEVEWIKVGSEWMQIDSILGSNLRVRRAGRGTRAAEHSSGTDVRIGREVQLTIPLLHGREGDV